MLCPDRWVHGDGNDWFAANAGDPESSNKAYQVSRSEGSDFESGLSPSSVPVAVMSMGEVMKRRIRVNE